MSAKFGNFREVYSYLKNIAGKKFSIDVFISFLSSIITGASGILLNVFIGNAYQSNGLGIFSQAVAIFMLTSLVAVFGMQTSLIKYSAEYKDNQIASNEILSAALILVFVISIFLLLAGYAAIYIAVSYIKNNDLILSLQIIILSLPLLSINKVLMGYLNGIRKMKYYSVMQSLRWMLIFLFISYCILIKASIDKLQYAFVFSEIILCLCLFIYIKKYYTFTLHGIKKWFAMHLSFGAKSVMTDSVAEMNAQVGLLLIGAMLGNAAAGIYSFASSIAKGLLLVTSVIQLNFNPIVSRLWASKELESLKSHMQKIRKISILVMSVVVVCAGAAYPVFVRFFMKDYHSFMSNLPLFYILLFGVLIVSYFYWAGGILSMAGFPELQLLMIIIVFVMNLLCSVLFIKLFGLNGIALASSLANVTMVLLIAFFSKKYMRINIFS